MKGNYFLLLNCNAEIINEFYESKIISNCLFEYKNDEFKSNVNSNKKINPSGILTCMERLAPVNHDIREIYALI